MGAARELHRHPDLSDGWEIGPSQGAVGRPDSVPSARRGLPRHRLICRGDGDRARCLSEVELASGGLPVLRDIDPEIGRDATRDFVPGLPREHHQAVVLGCVQDDGRLDEPVSEHLLVVIGQDRPAAGRKQDRTNQDLEAAQPTSVAGLADLARYELARGQVQHPGPARSANARPSMDQAESWSADRVARKLKRILE